MATGIDVFKGVITDHEQRITVVEHYGELLTLQAQSQQKYAGNKAKRSHSKALSQRSGLAECSGLTAKRYHSEAVLQSAAVSQQSAL